MTSIDHQIIISEDLGFPLEAATETFALLAIRGAGKTHCAQVMANEFLRNRVPFVVLDPVGVWWGLRITSGGIPNPYGQVVILGGEHGDVPLVLEMAERLAEIVAENSVFMVLDLSLFSKSKRTQFVTAFIETLYHQNRNALHVFMDEADQFIPQRPQPDQQRMIGAVDDMVRLGRNRGIGVTLISQRSAKINKDVLTQCGTLIALRTIGTPDRNAIKEWVEANGTVEQMKELMSTIASLETGEAWVWSPFWLKIFCRIKVRMRETFDSSATPKVGEQRVAPQFERLDMGWLQKELNSGEKVLLTDNADVRQLRQQVDELHAQLGEAAQKQTVEYVEIPALSEDIRLQLQEAFQNMSKLCLMVLTELGRIPEPLSPRLPPREMIYEATESDADEESREESADDGQISGQPLNMLRNLCSAPGAITRHQLALLTMIKPGGSTFNRYLTVLSSAGLVMKLDAHYLSPSNKGREVAGNVEVMTLAQMRQQWVRKLGGQVGRMFECLLNIYPDALTRNDLADAIGVQPGGSTFNRYLSELNSNSLIVKHGNTIQAHPVLFEGA